MNRILSWLAALASTSSVACASAPAHHDAPSSPPALDVPSARVIVLPGAVVGPGQPKEARVVFESAPLKLATIILRQGATLSAHDAPVPVTIVALSGAGVVTVGDERLPLDAGHAVFLGPNVSHAVVPEPGTDLVLIVHHLGRGAEHHHP